MELQDENSQLKEELAFLQKLVADSNKQVGLSIQRFAVERERDDACHYSLLLVRGGSPTRRVRGQPDAAGDRCSRRRAAPRRAPITLTLPEDQPETAQRRCRSNSSIISGLRDLPRPAGQQRARACTRARFRNRPGQPAGDPQP